MVLLDFLVVVTGVFVALAAETWWSEREERRFERELREGMIVEFESIVRILNAYIATNEEAQESFRLLEGLTYDTLPALARNPGRLLPL